MCLKRKISIEKYSFLQDYGRVDFFTNVMGAISSMKKKPYDHYVMGLELPYRSQDSRFVSTGVEFLADWKSGKLKVDHEVMVDYDPTKFVISSSSVTRVIGDSFDRKFGKQRTDKTIKELLVENLRIPADNVIVENSFYQDAVLEMLKKHTHDKQMTLF